MFLPAFICLLLCLICFLAKSPAQLELDSKNPMGGGAGEGSLFSSFLRLWFGMAAGAFFRFKPAHFIFLSFHPFIQEGRFSTYCSPFLVVQIVRVIFCVFLETDFVIYKRKMSLLFQGTCVYSQLTGVNTPASLAVIYYLLICWSALANELINT